MAGFVGSIFLEKATVVFEDKHQCRSQETPGGGAEVLEKGEGEKEQTIRLGILMPHKGDGIIR